MIRALPVSFLAYCFHEAVLDSLCSFVLCIVLQSLAVHVSEMVRALPISVLASWSHETIFWPFQYCNTLQGIALHYCTLQHNATQCKTMMWKTVLRLFELSLNMWVINPIYLRVLQRVAMCCRVDAMCHNMIVCGFLALQTLYTNPCVCVCRCHWVWMCGPTHMGIKF